MGRLAQDVPCSRTSPRGAPRAARRFLDPRFATWPVITDRERPGIWPGALKCQRCALRYFNS